MKDLEERFGRRHPALEGFKDPPPAMRWLVDAFFRLHRRRQHTENGFQPLQYQEMAHFSDHVLRVDRDLRRLYFRAMEETDNAVLYDHYSKSKERVETAKAASKPPKKSRPSR